MATAYLKRGRFLILRQLRARTTEVMMTMIRTMVNTTTIKNKNKIRIIMQSGCGPRLRICLLFGLPPALKCPSSALLRARCSSLHFAPIPLLAESGEPVSFPSVAARDLTVRAFSTNLA